MGRLLRLLLVACLSLVLSAAGRASQAPSAACRTFQETGKAVCDPFLAYWDGHGGLAQQGLPLTGAFAEVSPIDGKTYQVQYFERARFELHPENQAPYDVLLGQLGREQYRARYAAPQAAGPGNTPGTPVPAGECVLFAETARAVCGPFLAYWRDHGGLAQQGLPLTDIFVEENLTDGRLYPTQYFERARFEYHMVPGGPDGAILLGLLGREQLAARYPAGAPPAGGVPVDPAARCDPSYPTVCIPPPPPVLGCGRIPYRNFPVLPPDPHAFDTDHDGVGCEDR